MLLPQSRKHLGMSLAETMLALAIGSMMMVVALKQYHFFAEDRDIQQVQTNLEVLFQAAALYYKANCSTNWDYFGNNASGVAGALDPSSSPTNPYALVNNAGTLIQTLLITPGYLSSAKWPVPPTEYIDSTAPNSGFVIQFNLLNSNYRNGSSTNHMLEATDTSYPQMGNIYFWQEQVAAKVRHPANVAAYQQLLGADCISSLDASGVTVYPCNNGSGNHTTGSYLVWTRLPTDALHESRSVLWQTVPQVNQFKEQYTHDTYYEFSNTNRGFSNWATTQYYLCGG